MAILLVDDDELVRGTALAIMEEAGYEVVEAGTASDALDVLKNRGRRITHLVTDVRMPGWQDGIDLAQAAMEEFPHLSVTIMSGFTGRRDDAFKRGAYYLQKPWTASQLLEVLGAPLP